MREWWRKYWPWLAYFAGLVLLGLGFRFGIWR